MNNEHPLESQLPTLQSEEILLKVNFAYSSVKLTVSLKALVHSLITFLEHSGDVSIVGKQFYSVIEDGDGETRFRKLLAAVGYAQNPHGFFSEIVRHLEQANYQNNILQTVNDLVLPKHLLLHILETILPGSKIFEVKTVKRLENLCNIVVPPEERDSLQQVIDLYPVRLSTHAIRQMFISPGVACQYLPFVDELNPEGLVHTWVGQFFRGIIEQMYQNRVIFMLNMNCPVYCRFCFRKHKECRNQKAPKKKHVMQALLYIKNNPGIKEVLLTGGDPFMNKPTLIGSINGLLRIKHVQTLRIATRSISYYPDIFYSRNSFWLKFLKTKALELQQKGKNLEIGTHFIHPDEVSLQSLDVISELVQSGIPVYVQTPFLNECNDDPEALMKLFKPLRAAGAEMHYIFIPCSPIQGNRRFKTPISTALTIAQKLRAHLSDRAIPRMCTATATGKIDWNASGWAVERDKKDPQFLWLRTPYTLDYFESFAPILQLSKMTRINNEGTIDVKFMADIGDERFLPGERESKVASISFDEKAEQTKNTTGKSLLHLQEKVLADQRMPDHLLQTGSASLFRINKTRVEIDCQATDDHMAFNLDYIRKDESITDVLISSQKDCIDALFRVGKIVHELHNINHVRAIRLRSLKFNYSPELYSPLVIKRLAAFNNLSIINPKRLEIETQFLHSSEFHPEHKGIINSLRLKGITVYNNTPLLSFINDSGPEIQKIAYLCRAYGIEFHHLYIAGLPIQNYWSNRYPIYVNQIIDIASFVRKYGSGREIPRYIVRTGLGEVDYSVVPHFFTGDEEGNVRVKLSAYSGEYYRKIDPTFVFPENVSTDEEGNPIVPVEGLKKLFVSF